MRTFQVVGYGTNPKGLTCGINRCVTSADQEEAHAQVMREAEAEGLTEIKINYVREVE